MTSPRRLPAPRVGIPRGSMVATVGATVGSKKVNGAPADGGAPPAGAKTSVASAVPRGTDGDAQRTSANDA